MSEVKLPLNISKEQFEEWKAKHGKDPEGKETVKVIVIKSKTADLEFRCVVRNPDKKILGMALPFMDKNVAKMCDILITNCWLGGDEVIKTFAPYNLSAGSQLLDFLSDAESEIQNF